MKTQTIIDRLGGPHAIGRHCNITGQAVSQWVRVPVRYVFALVEMAREGGRELTPHQIRPDVYPHRLDGTRGNAKRTSA